MKVKLSQAFDLQMGKTPARNNAAYWDGNIKWVSIADIGNSGKYISDTKECMTDVGVRESGIKKVPKGTVIMSFKLSIGKTAITAEDMYTNEAIMAFIDKGTYDVDPNYLYQLCCGKSWTAGTNKAVMGLTLNKATLSEIEIELPSLAEQQEIAALLDKLDNIISARHRELDLLDELVKSRFIELFGDPESNNNNWATVSIGDVIQSCESGWSGNGTQRKKTLGEIAVLKVSAVTKGYFIPEECKVLDDQQNIKKYVFPEKGDLLFSRANTREMVGATAVIMQDYPELILPDKLWKIRFMNCANVIYMKHILSHQLIRSKFSAVSTGTSGSMFNVSMEKFKSIVIPLPPIALQEQFAAFVEQTDKSKLCGEMEVAA